MRFVCKHCDSKYSIADEKVRGKVLKVRCKKCGNIIKVRDPEFAKASLVPPPATESSAPKKRPSKPTSHAPIPQRRKSQAPPPARPSRPPVPKADPSVLENKFASSFKSKGKAKGTPGLYDAVKRSAEVIGKSESELVHWFVAIDDQPTGPVTAIKVHEHQKAKRIDDNSLIWKEGMADWVPLRNCKEMVGLLARLDLEQMTETVPETVAEPEEKEKPKLGLFEELDGAQSPLKGRSVGMIADRADVAEEHKPEEKEPSVIRVLPTVPSDTRDLEDSFFKMGGPGDVQQGSAIHSLTPHKPTQNRVIMIAAVGFFAVALSILAFLILGEGQTVETKTVTNTVEKVIEKVVYRDRLIESKPKVFRVEDDAKKKTKDTKRSGAKRVPKTDSSEMEARTAALMAQLGGSGDERSPSGSNRSLIPDTKGADTKGALSAGQIKIVVNKNKRALKACYERALKKGDAPDSRDIKVVFNLTIGASGTVLKAKIAGDGARIESLKQCLTSSIKKWVFPTSSGNSPVEFPFVFSPV